MQPSMNHVAPPPVFASLKSGVKDILLMLELLHEIQEEKSSTTTKGPAQQFLAISKQVKDQLKLKSSVLVEILSKAGLPLDFTTIDQLLLTWLDSDLLNVAPEHLGVLLISLLMAREFISSRSTSRKVAAIAAKPINELIFALSPYIEDIPVAPTLFALNGLVDAELISSEMARLKIEHPKPKTLSAQENTVHSSVTRFSIFQKRINEIANVYINKSRNFADKRKK